MTQVRLDPMTDDEYRVERARLVAEYAAEHVSTGNWPAEGAEARAAAEHAEMLPEGTATADHYWRTVRDGDRRVGMIWWGRSPYGAGHIAYIYAMAVDAELRGRGYGGAILTALEDEVRAAGLAAVRLHVFGDNAAARGLYRKLGFVETNVMMTKHLD